MKKIIIVIIVAIIAVPTILQAQVENKNRFVLGMTEFTNYTFKVGYERDIKDNSIELQLGVKYYMDQYYNVLQEQSLIAELRYNINILTFDFKKTSLEIEFSPYFKYKKYDFKSQDYDTYYYLPVYYSDNGSQFVGGVAASINWVVAKRLVLGAYFGGGFAYATSVDNARYVDIMDPTYRGILPDAGIEIGFTF